jgi:hypothetical protein
VPFDFEIYCGEMVGGIRMLLKLVLPVFLVLILAQSAEIKQRDLTRPNVAQSQVVTLQEEKKSWGCYRDSDDDPGFESRIPPLVISPDRILVTVCNTLFMLDGNKRVLWKWSGRSGAPFTDQPVVDSTGTIYAIGLDLYWLALDVETGEVKWRSTAVGSATYAQIEPYRDDHYLLVVNMENYREGLTSDTQDTLYLCKGTEVVGEADFPPNARLQVWGDRILALSQIKDRMEITEIRMSGVGMK